MPIVCIFVAVIFVGTTFRLKVKVKKERKRKRRNRESLHVFCINEFVVKKYD